MSYANNINNFLEGLKANELYNILAGDTFGTDLVSLQKVAKQIYRDANQMDTQMKNDEGYRGVKRKSEYRYEDPILDKIPRVSYVKKEKQRDQIQSSCAMEL